MSEDRLISPDAVSEELSQDRALRPKLLIDYVGQDEVCEQMDIFIRAAIQRRIQGFFYHRTQTVNFIDKEHVMRLKIGQDRGEIAGFLQHRTRRLAQVNLQFVGNNMRQGGLAQSRGTKN
jgi:hypothetical protein